MDEINKVIVVVANMHYLEEIIDLILLETSVTWNDIARFHDYFAVMYVLKVEIVGLGLSNDFPPIIVTSLVEELTPEQDRIRDEIRSIIVRWWNNYQQQKINIKLNKVKPTE